MKKTLFILCLLFVSILVHAQNYDVLTYHFNGTPVNGIKIKTNMPFTNGSQMPTIIIEGYNLGTASPIGLILTYYVLNNVFTNPSLSSFGAYVPSVYLANEGGKVTIFINSKDYYLRMSIRAFAQGLPAETTVNFQGWTTADEALSGTAQLLVPYRNRFAGDVQLQHGIWNKDGNVGVGTVAPVTRMSVYGSTDNEGAISLQSGANSRFYIQQGGALLKIGGITNGGSGVINIMNTGNVGIGTTTPGSYKLAVDGTIGARKIKVTQETWADFVFAPDYNPPSLQEVEKYIKSKQHLPDIPSASEIQKEGLDVGEMNKKLLQKIEELTLYVIEQNKKITKLEAVDKANRDLLIELQDKVNKLTK